MGHISIFQERVDTKIWCFQIRPEKLLHVIMHEAMWHEWEWLHEWKHLFSMYYIYLSLISNNAGCVEKQQWRSLIAVVILRRKMWKCLILIKSSSSPLCSNDHFFDAGSGLSIRGHEMANWCLDAGPANHFSWLNQTFKK